MYAACFAILAMGYFGGSSVFAQQTDSTTATSSEGLPVLTPQEEQQKSNWRSSSNMVRTRVEQLSAEPQASLPIPILFGVTRSNLTANFGDPRSGGRTHEGLDIMAPRGALIVSPTAAVVLGRGVWAGAGNYVSTANPGGETFVYMHLDQPSALNSGDLLEPGDLIGFVGNTGNAAGGATHLHFEIRKNNVATDPLPRLTQDLALAEKIKFAEKILSRSPDRVSLVRFLVATYGSELGTAKSSAVTLPTDIEQEMQRVANERATGAAAFTNLTFGARSEEVVAMQNFLILQNKGPAAQTLARAGATGYFGAITQNALNEYRGTSPIVTPPWAGSGQATLPASSTSSVPTSNLTIGARSGEVVWLQAFLISANAGPAAQYLARSGATGYFGGITRAALAEYQNRMGIFPAVGYFGPLTRAYLNSL